MVILMSLFRLDLRPGNGRRLTGGARYRELLGRDLLRFLIVNLLTLLGLLPLTVGIAYAILSSSILFLLPACIVGGLIAGPAMACMHDTILRSLRDAPGKTAENYKRALRQNWRQSLIPGIVFSLMLGFYAFMIMLLWWSETPPGFGTIALLSFGMLLFFMFFSIYWQLLALFDQPQHKRILNCLLFIAKFFWKVFFCAVQQIAYWAVLILFMPLSLILLPFTGVWFILFTANFKLYDTMNETFEIEKQIAEAFPEQEVVYEDDEAWLKRKQEEMRNGINGSGSYSHF